MPDSHFLPAQAARETTYCSVGTYYAPQHLNIGSISETVIYSINSSDIGGCITHQYVQPSRLQDTIAMIAHILMFLCLDFASFRQVGTSLFNDLGPNQHFIDSTTEMGRFAHYIKSKEKAVSVLSYCTVYDKTEKPHREQSFRVLDPK